MKGYKGFNRHEDGALWCLDFQYEVGKTYTFDDKIVLCSRGFHACHELHQTWSFYPNDGTIVYYEVECGGDIIESDEGDGKFVCSEITLLKEVDMSGVERFDYCDSFIEGFGIVELNGKANYLTTEGKILSEQWFDECYVFVEGFARIMLNEKWNYLTTEGKVLSEQWFDGCRSFSEGFAKIRLNWKYNYITTEGKYLSETWFDDCYRFSEGFGIVKLNWKENYLTPEGKFLSEQWFDVCWSFRGGFGIVELNGKEYHIDKNGFLTDL